MPRPPTPGPGPAMADPRWDYLNRFSLAYELHARLATARSRSEVADILLPELEGELEADVALLVLVDRATGRPTVFGGSEELRREIGGTLRGLPLPELRRVMEAGPDLAGQTHRMVVPIRIGLSQNGLLMIAGPRPFGDPDRIALEAVATFLGVLLRQMTLQQELDRAYRELRRTRDGASRQERLESLGQLASGMAEGLGRVVAPVPAWSGLLLSTARGLDDTERRALKRVREAGAEATRILDGMLEAAHTRTGDERELVPLDPEGLLADVVADARHLWEDEETGGESRVRVHVEPGTPPVLGSGPELRDAVAQLLSNALAAVRARGGTVVLRARASERPSDDLPQGAGGEVVLEVEDTGIGMDAATLARCMDPFFSTRADPGAGMGLAQVRSTARRHGGRLVLESRPGEGTRAAIILPSFRNGPRSEGARTPPSSLRVLVLDPDPTFGTLVSQILLFQGHRVARASTAAEAVAAFVEALEDEDAFRVVVAGAGAPDDVAPEVLAALHEADPGLALVLAGSWSRPASERPAGLLGMISKPLRPGQLEDVLRRIPRA
ncbi:MAG TPA: hybrid sensor histidine kinase/response regulator [Longimicrobiales bacterium]|nr:hybrid sensor histidine kinase/response regulator [Longimicrobiales bacterium]